MCVAGRIANGIFASVCLYRVEWVVVPFAVERLDHAR